MIFAAGNAVDSLSGGGGTIVASPAFAMCRDLVVSDQFLDPSLRSSPRQIWEKLQKRPQGQPFTRCSNDVEQFCHAGHSQFGAV